MKNEVKKVIATVFELEINEITDDINQENFPKWDSLQHLNLMIELEEIFEVSFEPEEIAEMVTIDKIIEIVKLKQ